MDIKKLNINYFIAFIIILSVTIGFLTIQTFAGKGLIDLTPINIQILLIINLLSLSLFLSFVIYKFFNIYATEKNKNIIGVKTKRKLFFYFISLAAIPGIVIAFFSVIIFNYSIEKWFDKKINSAVNNSTELAKRYLKEHQISIGKDILLVASDFNRNVKKLLVDKNKFENFISIQGNLRSFENIYLVSSNGNLKFSKPNINTKNYIKPDVYMLSAAKKGKPVIISSAYTNKTYGMVKLSSFDNLFLYIVKNVDPQILSYIKETGTISEYYFSIKSNIFNLQVTFMIIYMIIILLLIFAASIVSINLSGYISNPLTQLFNASSEIEKGNYNINLENKNLDSDFSQLYSTFNNMLKRIKDDQIKKSLEGRYDAWNLIAKKLAHEIKNPLTPIQLSLDRINNKFKNQITTDKKLFEDHIKTINFQITEITNLLNSFSDFARMPEPIFLSNNFIEILKKAIFPYKTNYPDILINIQSELKSEFVKCDKNQIFRLFTNLVKNSIESILEKKSTSPNIFIYLQEGTNSIDVLFQDSGLGFETNQLKSVSEPYFTTKDNGSGLGLSIVSKIVFEHGGTISFYNNEKKNGANIHFTLSKNL
jgi:two-component system nitrogen regulation sensor histidine kinase NtrY